MKKNSLLCALLLSAALVNAQDVATVSGVYPFPELTGQDTVVLLEGVSPHMDTYRMSVISRTFDQPVTFQSPDIERLIIVKDGRLKVTVDMKSAILGPAGVTLIMPGEKHQLASPDSVPATFYVMEYCSKKPADPTRARTAGGSVLVPFNAVNYKPSSKGGGYAYFDRATAMCERFEMHITHLAGKGPSHQPHQHVETEVILVLLGETEMTIDDQAYQAGAGDLYFVHSGQMHGVGNVNDEPCRYFAFKWY